MARSSEEIARIFPAMVEYFIPEKAVGVDAVVQFELSGDNGGVFWLKINDGTAQTGLGSVDDAKMTVRAAADDYFDLAVGNLDPIKAFTSGRVKIQGDMGLAIRLTTMFTLPG